MSNAEARCRWPGCEVEHPTISIDDEWFCFTHIDDGFLPPLKVGPIGDCAHCEKRTVRILVRETGELTWVHEDCLRAWTRLQQAGEENEQPSREIRGAYGRKRSKT